MSKQEKVEKTERQALWEEHLANYAQSNPVKYASKKANGEFNEIPASFVGKVVVNKGKKAIF